MRRPRPAAAEPLRAVVVLISLLSPAASAASDDGLVPGAVLDQTNAEAARSLLPPEILAHYRAGEYRNAIAAWPSGPHWEPSFAAASEKNGARLDVDESGAIVDRASKEPARGIYGLPFLIDPADPRAGVKVVWNGYYALWRIGSTHDVLEIDWVGKRGLERQALLESRTLYYEGAPPGLTPNQNPLDLAAQLSAIVTAPADLHGTATLEWRSRAATKRDQSWTYIPALRRVREVSPANRSDGFLGSDMTQDDGPFFNGKPEDFTWRLVGERETLVFADPRSLEGRVARKVDASGGISDQWEPGEKVAGFQDPAWKGLSWAPIAPVLARRKVWVVEATPRDPRYLYSRIELALDKETFQGATSRKFDASGTLLRSLVFLAHAAQPIEVGGERLLLPASSMEYVLAENTKAGRATVIGTVPPGSSVHERRMPLDPAVFELDRLGAGK